MSENSTSCETRASEEDRPDDHFGLCPECHSTDGYFNVGSGHWFKCDTHKVRWWAGTNIFSGWRHESEAEQRAIYALHEDYEYVKPYFYSDSQDAEAAVEVHSADGGDDFDDDGSASELTEEPVM